MRTGTFSLTIALVLSIGSLVALGHLASSDVRDALRSAASVQAQSAVPITHAQRIFLLGASDPTGAYRVPDGVAVDRAAGIVYVVDRTNGRITAHDRRGRVLRVIGGWGTGEGRLVFPDGIDVAPDGTIYVADWGNKRIQRFAADGSWLGAFGAADDGPNAFEGPEPSDVAVGPDGSVYTGGWRRVQRYDPHGRLITSWDAEGCGRATEGISQWPGLTATMSGEWVEALDVLRIGLRTASERTGLQSPRPSAPMTSVRWLASMLATADDGTLYAGTPNGVARFTADGQCLGRFGSQGIAPGRFGAPLPLGIDVGPDGEVYVADGAWSRIQHFGPDGQLRGVRNIYGGVQDVAVAAGGTLYATQAGDGKADGRVLRMTGEGHLLETWGRADNLPPDADRPAGIAVRADGDVEVGVGDRILRYTADGGFVESIGAPGTAVGRLGGAAGLIPTADGGRYVAESRNGRVSLLDPEGEPLRIIGDEYLEQPTDLAFADLFSMRLLYTTDAPQHRLSMFQSSGVWFGDKGIIGEELGAFDMPSGIATLGFREFWIADRGNHRIVYFQERAGGEARSIGSEGDGPGELREPFDVVIGADRRIYVADTGNDRVSVFAADGLPIDQWTGERSRAGRMRAPRSLTSGLEGDRLFVADTGRGRVRKLDLAGEVITDWETPGYGDGNLRPRGPFDGANNLDIVAAADGHIFVLDPAQSVVQEYGRDGRFASSWPAADPASDVKYSSALAIAPNGRLALMAHDADWNDQIVIHDREGRRLDRWTPQLEEEGWLRDLTFSDAGDLYLLHDGDRSMRVERYSIDGRFVLSWTLPSDSGFERIQSGPDDSLYLAGSGLVVRYDHQGGPLSSWPVAEGARIYGFAVADDGGFYLNRIDRAELEAYSRDGRLRGRVATEDACDGTLGRIDHNPPGFPRFHVRELAIHPDGHLLVAWASGCVEAYRLDPEGSPPWRMELFADPNLAESPRLIDQLESVALDWGLDRPHPQLPADGFSARLEKRIHLTRTQRLELDVHARGGLRMWVDSQLIADAWTEVSPSASASVTRDLAAGPHRILVEFKDLGGPARLDIRDRLADLNALPDPTWTPLAATPTATVETTESGGPGDQKIHLPELRLHRP